MPQHSTALARSAGTGPSPKATEQLRQGLKRTVPFPGQMPIRYQRLVAIDLYARFLLVQPDWKGLVASGYGASGMGVQLSFSIDAGAFILPGFMNLSVEASAGVSRAASVIVCMHRSMPRSFAYNPYAQPWQSSNPVCLMALFGKTMSVHAAAAVEVSLLQELPEIPQAQAQAAVSQLSSLTEIPLALSIGAGLEAGYQYDTLYAVDPTPGWYPSAEHQGLKDDFNLVLLPGKRTTKQEIRQWIHSFDRQIYPLNDTTLQLLIANRYELYIAIVNKQLTLLQRRRLDDGSRLKKTWKRVRSEVTSTFSGAPVVRQIAQWVGSFESSIDTTDGLLNFINNLKYLIPPTDFVDACSFDSSVSPSEIELIKNVFLGFSKQLDTFTNDLKASQALAQSPVDIPRKLDSARRFPQARPSDPLNCFLTIASHTAEATASVQAQAIGAYANMGISGAYKKTAYRYQTFTPADTGRQVLVYTQDTSITYREAATSAGAGVARFAKEFTKDLRARGMTYQSACVYWLYPESRGSGVVQAGKGSGLSYGVSVNTDDLIACVHEVQVHQMELTSQPDTAPPSMTTYRLIRLLARYLRLSLPHLIGFLVRRDSSFLGANIPTPAVLLEASYALPSGAVYALEPTPAPGPANPSSPLYRMQSLWQPSRAASPAPALAASLNTADAPGRLALCSQYLQAIRIRARMADYRQSAVSFKLGVPFSAAAAAITLSKIEMAGQDGVMDIEQDYWTTDSYDDCVPPVVIFHQ